MKNIKLFLKTMFATSIFWFLVVSFINWDLTWPTNIPNLEVEGRVFMFLCICVKIICDLLILLAIKDEIGAKE